MSQTPDFHTIQMEDVTTDLFKVCRLCEDTRERAEVTLSFVPERGPAFALHLCAVHVTMLYRVSETWLLDHIAPADDLRLPGSTLSYHPARRHLQLVPRHDGGFGR